MGDQLGNVLFLGADQFLGRPIELAVRQTFELSEVALEPFERRLPPEELVMKLYSAVLERPQAAKGRRRPNDMKVERPHLIVR